MTSLAVTPRPRWPSTRSSNVLGLDCSSVCVASTCSTSLVPMPKARGAEGAVGGSVAVAADDGHARLGDASSGPMMWTMPCCGLLRSYRRMPNSLAVIAEGVDLLLGNGVGNWQAAVGRGDVMVGGGDGEIRAATLRSARRRPSNACALVTSWTRCKSM